MSDSEQTKIPEVVVDTVWEMQDILQAAIGGDLLYRLLAHCIPLYLWVQG